MAEMGYSPPDPTRPPYRLSGVRDASSRSSRSQSLGATQRPLSSFAFMNGISHPDYRNEVSGSGGRSTQRPLSSFAFMNGISRPDRKEVSGSGGRSTQHSTSSASTRPSQHASQNPRASTSYTSSPSARASQAQHVSQHSRAPTHHASPRTGTLRKKQGYSGTGQMGEDLDALGKLLKEYRKSGLEHERR
ncbi:hypothetical protein BDV95DRAFT_580401 [Massariosphaeria phaeospora]|uniref:Uncharacterized protein n=1 Tax=Massariosphaeria phaeospora TaxID=100035 RepID=A0A7C8M421_9PLEO|nr:hypothetical protein BDV95DRAFT_580401 [Massariosphaeria phaeospora]